MYRTICLIYIIYHVHVEISNKARLAYFPNMQTSKVKLNVCLDLIFSQVILSTVNCTSQQINCIARNSLNRLKRHYYRCRRVIPNI